MRATSHIDILFRPILSAVWVTPKKSWRLAKEKRRADIDSLTLTATPLSLRSPRLFEKELAVKLVQHASDTAHRRTFACALFLLITLLSGCATPYVAPRNAGLVTPALHDTHAVMPDAYVLPLTRWQPSAPPRAVVLALHGLNDYRNAHAGVGPYLAARGVAVYAYDQRGFGATKDAGYWHGADRLVEDALIMTQLLRTRHSDTPLYVLGESMGGAVLLAALPHNPPLAADGIVLVAPAVWARSTMPWYQRFALWVTARTLPGKRFSGKGLKITPSDNKEMLRALGRDPLVIKQTRADVLHGMANLMDRALAAAPHVAMPTLILYGEHDEIIPKRPTCSMFAALPNNPHPESRTLIYPNGYHMLTRDLQAKVVWQDLAAWLVEHNDPPPSLELAPATRADALSWCNATN